MKLSNSFKAGVCLASLCAASLASAQSHQAHSASPGPEYARVISSTAVQTAVSVPREVCGSEQVTTPGRTSGAGAIMGAIAGGAMGNAIGKGSGRDLATAVGVVGGALLGDRIEGPATPQTHATQRCVTQNITEYRTTGYNVVYEYAGKQYSVQMPQDPGQWLKVQVSPAAAQTPAMTQHAPLGMISSAPAKVQHARVVQPVPVVISPVLGYSVGRHHHHPHAGVTFSYGPPAYGRWY